MISMRPAAIIVLLMMVFLALPASAQNVRPPGNAVISETPQGGTANTLGLNSQSEFWRALRQGEGGLATSGASGGPLIQSQGEQWRLIRIGYLIKYSGWVLVAVIGLIALFFLVRGRIKIKSGRSGRVIARFSLSERVVHWFTACVFIVLAISGLVLLIGKPVLMPLIGKNAFGIIASASMQGHNLIGPLYIVAVVLMFFTFMRGNMLQLVDFKWLLKGGGFFGGHVSSHRYNFGEKSWFWLATMVGLLMSVTGAVLLLPGLLPELFYLQAASVLHAVGAVLLIAFALGHIYIGTLGIEGALESMTRGTVDENWAREHHDLWYQDQVDNAVSDTVAAETHTAQSET